VRVLERVDREPRWTLLFVVVLSVAFVDQITKAVVRVTLEPGEQVQLPGAFSFHYVQNPGIAGGELRGGALPLALVAIAVVAWVHAYLVHRRGFRLALLVGFGLLLGGGIGNLVDRLRLGWVIDFIRQDDHAFNLADVAIFTGTTIILTALTASLVMSRWPGRPTPGTASGD
jgi:signal peptidase II